LLICSYICVPERRKQVHRIWSAAEKNALYLAFGLYLNEQGATAPGKKEIDKAITKYPALCHRTSTNIKYQLKNMVARLR
jgi:hypothetical protein